MKLICALIPFLVILCVASLPAQINNPIIFEGDETDSLLKAEFRFTPLPAYGQVCSLHVKLTAVGPELNQRAMSQRQPNVNNPKLKPVGKRQDVFKPDTTIILSMTAGPDPYFEMPDTAIVWMMPINDGDSLTAAFPIFINGVGEYNLILAEKGFLKDFLKFHLTIVIDEEGKLSYLGKIPPPYPNPLEAHPYAFGPKMKTSLAGQKMPKGKGLLQAFDIEMSIEPMPKVGQKSKVSCSIAAMSTDIEQIQYEIVRATNLKIDTIPASQGDNPGEAQRFDVSFGIIPLAVGRSFLSFEAIGHPVGSVPGKVVKSKMGYHLIFGSDSSLLYIGENDPFSVGFEPGNPAYYRIEAIMDFDSTLYGLKPERSLPDYMMKRKQEERIQDSIRREASRDTIDIPEN
jgi:hypothetical protein